MLERIEQVLDEQVRPQLQSHGGEIEVLSFEDGVVRFKLTGQCAGCPSADLTAEQLVKEALVSALPEVRDAVLYQTVSDDLLDFAKRILRGERPE